MVYDIYMKINRFKNRFIRVRLFKRAIGNIPDKEKCCETNYKYEASILVELHYETEHTNINNR